MVLALAWAVYLIPKALKHHDEIARTRSIDRFSTAMRVLARREPVNRRDARLVVTPARPAESTRMVVPTRPAPQTAPQAAPEQATRPAARTASPASRRAAARAAARRRRRVLGVLVALDLVVVALAAFAVAPWWTVAVPAALTGVYLYLCRRQVRRENDASWASEESAAPQQAAGAPAAPRRAIRVEAPYGTVQAPRVAVRDEAAAGFEEFSEDEDTVAISVAALDAALAAPDVSAAAVAAARAVEVETVAVAVPTVDGGSLWDPLPVTLPTYVTKPRASRTVRTIDLSEPGTWSSGRNEADSRLVEEAGVAAQEDAQVEQEGRRAVGS